MSSSYSLGINLQDYFRVRKLRQDTQRAAREADLAQRIQVLMKKGEAPIPAVPATAEKFSISPPLTIPLFNLTSPYTSATPYPAYQWDAVLNQPATGSDDINLQALADPTTGRISLGLIGGNFPGGWSAPSFSIPMRGRWLLGEQTGVSASVLSYQSLGVGSNNPPFPVGASDLIVNARLFNQLTNIDAMMQSNLGTAMLIWPGKSIASAQGLVAAQGYFTLTATLKLGSAVIISESRSITFLERVAFQPDPNARPDSNPGVILSNIWLFGPSQILDLVVVLPFVADAAKRSGYTVLIEAEVGLAAMRGGVDDPHGGSIVLAFQDITAASPKTSLLPYYPNPFDVLLMTASLTQL